MAWKGEAIELHGIAEICRASRKDIVGKFGHHQSDFAAETAGAPYCVDAFSLAREPTEMNSSHLLDVFTLDRLRLAQPLVRNRRQTTAFSGNVPSSSCGIMLFSSLTQRNRLQNLSSWTPHELVPDLKAVVARPSASSGSFAASCRCLPEPDAQCPSILYIGLRRHFACCHRSVHSAELAKLTAMLFVF